MIRFITALALSAALFAGVVASAAQLPIEGGTVQAGVTEVASCDSDGVIAAYTVGWVDGRFVVSEVTISDIHADCLGKTITIVVVDAFDQVRAASRTIVAADSQSFPLETFMSAFQFSFSRLAVEIHDTPAGRF
jgi:hypothetical protein